MEISLSFDNAIINAAVLKDMSPNWRRRFITWGMPIAVGGMRLLFPIVIVCLSAMLSPIHAIALAYSDPQQYAKLLSNARPIIDAFGGMFLLMIFLTFIFEEKEICWIKTIEEKLPRLGKLEFKLAIILVVLLEITNQLGCIAFAGVFLYGLLRIFVKDHKTVHSGLGAFLYLEMIDASCSFDGVVGAFVLTNNILYIAVGLGIGAFCIRVLTLHLVKGGVLKEYIYLEHGAHYAIGILGAIMLMDIYHPVPEPVTGMCGISIIGLSLLSSWKNKV